MNRPLKPHAGDQFLNPPTKADGPFVGFVKSLSPLFVLVAGLATIIFGPPLVVLIMIGLFMGNPTGFADQSSQVLALAPPFVRIFGAGLCILAIKWWIDGVEAEEPHVEVEPEPMPIPTETLTSSVPTEPTTAPSVAEQWARDLRGGR